MPLAYAAIGLGILFLISGLKGQSLADVLNGRDGGGALDPAGGKGQTISFFSDPAGGSSGGSTGGNTGSQGNPPGASSTAADGTTMMDGKPVANWIAPILKWAKANGWKGKVNSGYRTAAEQQQAATNYGLQHYGSGGPQASNHRRTKYPGGAVDVTEAAQLNEVLKRYKGSPTLVWAGPTIGDWVHFSANGH